MRLNNRFKRQAKGEVLLYFIVSAVFMVVALSYLFMFGWMAVAGFSTHKEIVLNPFKFPEALHWENYFDVFSVFTLVLRIFALGIFSPHRLPHRNPPTYPSSN